MSKKLPPPHLALAKCLLRILKHLDDREMTLTDQRIMTAVQIGQTKEPVGIPIQEIAKLAGLSKEEVMHSLPAMVETRHIHEFVPTFGPRLLYKLGSVGQTFFNAVGREFDRHCDF